MTASKKTTHLTPEEDKAWVHAFCYYLDNGYSKEKADKYAWLDLQKEFPRLKEFDGCQKD